MRSTIIGFILAFAATGLSLWLTNTNYVLYVNLVGMIIVFGGTLASAFISFGFATLVRVTTGYWHVLKKAHYTPKIVISQIIDTAFQQHNNHNNRGLQKNGLAIHPFLLDGLKLVENDFSEEQIDEIMFSATMERKNYFDRDIEVFEAIAKYPPAFGMVGTLFGLIALLNNLSGDGNIAAIGPNMAVALITTMYGLLFTNYFLSPISENLIVHLKDEMLLRRIISRGVALIAKGEDPVLIEEMLKAHLLPRQRIALEKVQMQKMKNVA